MKRETKPQRRDYFRQWRARNLEKVRAYAREYARKRYAANPAAGRAKSKAWREANPERRRDIARRSRLKHIEKARERKRRWYQTEKGRHCQRAAARRKWARTPEEKREKIRVKKRAWRRANLAESIKGLEAWKRAHPEKLNKANALNDSYVRGMLRLLGWPRGHKIPRDLIEAKRLETIIKRSTTQRRKK